MPTQEPKPLGTDVTHRTVDIWRNAHAGMGLPTTAAMFRLNAQSLGHQSFAPNGFCVCVLCAISVRSKADAVRFVSLPVLSAEAMRAEGAFFVKRLALFGR